MCVGVWGGKGEKGREGYQAVPPTRRDSERVGRRRVTEKEMEKNLKIGKNQAGSRHRKGRCWRRRAGGKTLRVCRSERTAAR